MTSVKIVSGDLSGGKSTKTAAELEEEEDDDEQGAEGEEQAEKKKKKKRNRKKKSATAGGAENGHAVGNATKGADAGTLYVPATGEIIKPAAEIRGLGSQGSSEFPLPREQTYPPRKPINEIFKNGKYTPGEEVRMELPRWHQGLDTQFRCGSQNVGSHERRDVPGASPRRRSASPNRKYVQNLIKPGMTMIEICEELEATSRALVAEKGTGSRFGLPDRLFVEPLRRSLHSQSGTPPTPESAWPDPIVPLNELGEAIQEVMESYEIELDGKVFPIKCIRNLQGHQIAQYRIHAGKSVPIVKGGETTRMAENEIYAIETFGTTGKGTVHDDNDCSHYMKNFDEQFVPLRLAKSKHLLNTITENFGTLAFCKRWLERAGAEKYLMSLKDLCEKGIVDPYPPLVDAKGCITAQYEHTILLRPTCKEVLSRGSDY
ncbi:Methionine aminopeptidase 2 [Hypsibius exemplaris]|uniref:Methionine aminopeptidase 2 n=1 Tax=Hypsibius exemplaris TaxID=2072580 RepID=A0A9X6NIA1_HYPEX|nr:Methionine aminopeptidase 2 [Hypsibius exemplaris]